MNPLHASYYADTAAQESAPIVENVAIAKDTFRVRIECPTIAKRIVPGQFLMMRLNGCDDPLLGRPLALYDVVHDAQGEPWAVDIVYLAAGKMTRRLAAYAPAQLVDIWGPLGNGFKPLESEHLIMVAGGIGQTPMLALAREALGVASYGNPPRVAGRARKVTLCYGARSAAYLAGLDDFRKAGLELLVSTDDGTEGHHGLVTDLLENVIRAPGRPDRRVVCCGPEKMMHAVAQICLAHSLPCQVSLETPMACGIGVCFSCVTRVHDAKGGWDYKRTCVDGPVFDAGQIAW